MNKKAIFFTLSAILILLVVFSIFLWESESSAQSGDANIQYATQKVTSDYMSDVGERYLPEFVSISEKYGLREISSYVAGDMDLAKNLTYTVMTGHIDNRTENPGTLVLARQYTLPYMINSTFSTLSGPLNFTRFDFSVDSVRQVSDTMIRVNSTVSFTLTGRMSAWGQESNITWNDSKKYSDEFSIIGFYDTRSKETMTDIWAVNSSYTCFIRTIDADAECGGFHGLCPFTNCPYSPP